MRAGEEFRAKARRAQRRGKKVTEGSGFLDRWLLQFRRFLSPQLANSAARGQGSHPTRSPCSRPPQLRWRGGPRLRARQSFPALGSELWAGEEFRAKREERNEEGRRLPKDQDFWIAGCFSLDDCLSPVGELGSLGSGQPPHPLTWFATSPTSLERWAATSRETFFQATSDQAPGRESFTRRHEER
jgi:hypothetical protein